MAKEKGVLNGGITMLLLKLLEGRDMYGYQIIEELAKRSNNTFTLKTGTLYPALHGLEKDKLVISYDAAAGNQRVRRYYHITESGKGMLSEKQSEWRAYSSAVNKVLKGGASYAAV